MWQNKHKHDQHNGQYIKYDRINNYLNKLPSNINLSQIKDVVCR
jgi:hypothetical protein